MMTSGPPGPAQLGRSETHTHAGLQNPFSSINSVLQFPSEMDVTTFTLVLGKLRFQSTVYRKEHLKPEIGKPGFAHKLRYSLSDLPRSKDFGFTTRDGEI